MTPEDRPLTSSTGSAAPLNAFLPLLLLGLSLGAVFLWQLTNISEQRSAFQALIARQDEMVKQSRQVQSNLEKLVLSLLDLARAGDADAKAIVAKYNIQQQGASPIAP